MEAFAERPLVDEASAEPHRELVDGKAFGDRAARFWNDIQGLPARNIAGNPTLRRTSQVYSRAGKFNGRAHRGSADFESETQERAVELRDWAKHPRVFRPDHGEIPAGLFDAAAAVFRDAGFGGDGTGFALDLFLAIKKIFFNESLMTQHGPLLLLAIALFVSGIQFISWDCWERSVRERIMNHKTRRSMRCAK